MDLASFQVGPWNEAKKKEKRPRKKMKTKKFHAKDKEIIQQVNEEE